MKPNEEKCLLSSQPTSLTFIPFILIGQKMREAAGSRVFPAVFELFSCATSRSSENFFIKKIHIGRRASFHLIVKKAKKIENAGIRTLREKSQDMAIFDLSFDMTWRRIKVVQSHGAFEHLWNKRSKVCKAVVSLNAFNARQNLSQSYWHVWPHL